MISFGPIPSRRLGKSLGINNIPSQKVCSYSCTYCQVGITKKMSLVRENFYEPEIIFTQIQKHLQKLKATDRPDYLTFVSNGEPMLDVNLGDTIFKLKQFNIPIAVITNATLLNDQKVRADLKLADWVSVKVDAGNETTWQSINRPIENLSFKKHLEGILQFSSEYKGKLCTETMLAESVNDSLDDLHQTSEFIKQINPSLAYISIPTRPPALKSVKSPKEPVINEAYQIFSGKNLNVELLIGFEGTDTGFTGNAIEDIINICTVHPIREDTMQELLKKNNADNYVLDSLLSKEYIKKVHYNSGNFYIRQFHT